MSYEAPYSYSSLVDHFASASETKETYANSTNVECPAKPSGYTCPKLLNVSKEELKSKICDYESVLNGVISFVADTDKAKTRCGSLKVNKQLVKCEEDAGYTSEGKKLAIVLGKECQLKSITDRSSGNDEIYMLTKNALPSGTTHIVADGANVDLMSSQAISKEEISSLLKQCPKVGSQ